MDEWRAHRRPQGRGDALDAFRSTEEGSALGGGKNISAQELKGKGKAGEKAGGFWVGRKAKLKKTSI